MHPHRPQLAIALLFALLPAGCGDTAPSQSGPATCDEISTPCATRGETTCSDDSSSLIECRTNAQGCLVWATKSSCGAYGNCENAACACQHECGYPDEQRCWENAVQRCRADAVGCLHWEDAQRCADTGKACEQQGIDAFCVGGCDVDGELRCTGNVLITCSEDAQGYLAWLVVVDCAVNEQICSTATGVAECISP